jgi:hypothetical protein
MPSPRKRHNPSRAGFPDWLRTPDVLDWL